MFASATSDRNGVRAAHPAGRYAACMDLENIAIVDNRLLSPGEMQILFGVIQRHVSGMPVRVATGVSVLRAYLHLPELQHWGLDLVTSAPDAADEALVDAALQFVNSGVTDLVVASGDWSFAALAAVARLHVISHPDHLSRRLRLAATTVTYLPFASRLVAA